MVNEISGWCEYSDCCVMQWEYHDLIYIYILVGGLEIDFFDFPYIGNGKSSQLTFTPFFGEGWWLNHQPDIYRSDLKLLKSHGLINFLFNFPLKFRLNHGDSIGEMRTDFVQWTSPLVMSK